MNFICIFPLLSLLFFPCSPHSFSFLTQTTPTLLHLSSHPPSPGNLPGYSGGLDSMALDCWWIQDVFLRSTDPWYDSNLQFSVCCGGHQIQILSEARFSPVPKTITNPCIFSCSLFFFFHFPSQSLPSSLFNLGCLLDLCNIDLDTSCILLCDLTFRSTCITLFVLVNFIENGEYWVKGLPNFTRFIS